MFYALVKFKNNPVPELFGTTHVSHAALLATMDGVEWVSPTIGRGSAIEHASTGGGAFDQGTLSRRIRGYVPDDQDR